MKGEDFTQYSLDLAASATGIRVTGLLEGKVTCLRAGRPTLGLLSDSCNGGRGCCGKRRQSPFGHWLMRPDLCLGLVS